MKVILVIAVFGLLATTGLALEGRRKQEEKVQNLIVDRPQKQSKGLLEKVRMSSSVAI